MTPNEVSTLEHLQRIMDERDCRYKQRFDAQEEALKLALDKVERSQASMIAWAALALAAIGIVMAVLK